MLLKSRLAKTFQGVSLLAAGCFYREIWKPSQDQVQAQVRLRARDPAAFEAGLQNALLRREPGHSTTALEVLEASGELSKEQARRLWADRLALQAWGDALRLLEDPRFARPKVAAYWHDLAAARVATGSTKGAVAAAREAVARDPSNPEIAELAAALERLEAYEARPDGAVNWHGFIDEVALLVDLHRFEQAATALAAGVARFGEAASAKKMNLAVELARTLFRVLDPTSVQSLFRCLRPAFAQRGLLEGYEWACEALGGPEGEAWRPPPLFGDEPFLLACIGQAFAAQGQWKRAAAFFGPVAILRKDPFDGRPELARCVGRQVIDEIQPVFAPATGPRKVVDVFRFQDELMLLKLKLEEMGPWVDRFVIVEARSTFTGLPKPVMFEQHRHEFAAWNDKIVHLVVDFPDWADSPWAREFYQRDIALAALSGYCGPEDIVLSTDADEIVDRRVIDSFAGEFAGLEMKVFKYFFNLRRRYEIDPVYTTAWRAKYLTRVGLSTTRVGLGRYSKWHVLQGGGWHFTSIKDAEALVIKLRAYSHTEYAGADSEELARRMAAIRKGEDFANHQRCEIDNEMPAALRDNRESFADFIL